MSSKTALPALLGLCLISPAASFASNIPFGIASAYNIVALGSNGLAGTITDQSDIGGRIAAASLGSSISQIGSNPITNDPYGYLASYDVVSPGGYNGAHVNVNSTGNVYAPGSSSSYFGFNGGGSLVNTTVTPPPINFTTLSTTLDNESAQLGALLNTGTAVLANNVLTLTGNSATLNIFNVTATQLASATDYLNIVAPVGSTIIVNVTGGAVSAPKLSYNGNQITGNSPTDDDILFNFYQATSVVMEGQFSASILAPYADITGNSQLDGTIIAAQFNDSGEIHNVEFTGILPDPSIIAATPEPSSLALLASGICGLATAIRRRIRR